jgi:hypothetical protein
MIIIFLYHGNNDLLHDFAFKKELCTEINRKNLYQRGDVCFSESNESCSNSFTFCLVFSCFFLVWLRSSGSTSRYTNNWGDRETFQHKFVSILPLFVFLFSFNLKIFHLFFNRNDFKIKNKRRRWRQSCVCAKGNIRRAFDWTVDP